MSPCQAVLQAVLPTILAPAFSAWTVIKNIETHGIFSGSRSASMSYMLATNSLSASAAYPPYCCLLVPLGHGAIDNFETDLGTPWEAIALAYTPLFANRQPTCNLEAAAVLACKE